jgi:hypothetical protein
MNFDEWWSDNYLKHNMRSVDWAKSAWNASRRNTAEEILTPLIQEEIRHILAVGNPQITTVSSAILVKLKELETEYLK